MNRPEVWLKGELQAQEYLKKHKYKILESNYNSPLGEIDIIAKIKDVIVFVEVKSRSSLRFGAPREAITKDKQQHIKRTAELYLKRNRMLKSKVRFDCIEILAGELTHYENIF